MNKGRLFKFISALTVLFLVASSSAVSADAEVAPSAVNVCNTPDCALTAATMINKMNLSANPCVDFGEYACGRLISEFVFSNGSTEMGTISTLVNENNQIMQNIIEERIIANHPMYLGNMKRLYRSCFRVARIERVGLTPYMNDVTFVNDWPTLNANWTQENFNLNDVIERYHRAYILPIMTFTVHPDLVNTSKNVIFLMEPRLGLSTEYLARPRNDSVIMAYQKYLINTAIELGATRRVARQDAIDVLDLEIALSKIMTPKELQFKYFLRYNPVALINLLDNIDVPRAIRAVFDTANISLPDNETIINFSKAYIGNLSTVMSRFSNRTQQNLFGFKYAISKVEGLTRRMRAIKFQFDQIIIGMKTQKPRREECLSFVSQVFPMGMSKQFVLRTLTESTKQMVEIMIDNLYAKFHNMLSNNIWMGQATKNYSLAKLAAITRKVGYPEAEFQDSDIEDKYKNYIMQESNFYSNRALYKKLLRLEHTLTLRKPINRNKWVYSPHEVQGYYSPIQNEIVFSAGILRPPYFSSTSQDSVNYGALGTVIGHEIMHAFDGRGSQFDADGNLRNWWNQSDRDTFQQKARCFVDQFSKFHFENINMSLNGINVHGEAMADTGGVKQSFRAYKELVRNNGEQPTLPNLGLTHDQQFFLSFAQLWCEKKTPEKLILYVTTTDHPTSKFRTIGALQNNEDFANAFNCSTGSYMNPANKCSVW